MTSYFWDCVTLWGCFHFLRCFCFSCHLYFWGPFNFVRTSSKLVNFILKRAPEVYWCFYRRLLPCFSDPLPIKGDSHMWKWSQFSHKLLCFLQYIYTTFSCKYSKENTLSSVQPSSTFTRIKPPLSHTGITASRREIWGLGDWGEEKQHLSTWCYSSHYRVALISE